MIERILRTSIIEANINDIWSEISKISSFHYIASPMLSLSPIIDKNIKRWSEGRVYFFKLKLFNLIPLGTHRLVLTMMDRFGHKIYSNESNDFITSWKHNISLEKIDENHSEYTDMIEFEAKKHSSLIRFFSELFLIHRQRRLAKLMRLQYQANKEPIKEV